MAHADWIVDLGPGAGHDGGRVVFEGTPTDVVAAHSNRCLDIKYELRPIARGEAAPRTRAALSLPSWRRSVALNEVAPKPGNSRPWRSF
jgi:hypothetical protein